MKKLLKILGMILVILIVGFIALVVFYRLGGGGEENFCKNLLNVDGHKQLLSKFFEDDEKRFEGKAYRYGTETKNYLNFKQCLVNDSYSACWEAFNLVKKETKLDAINFYLATGAILEDCANVGK